MKKTIAMLLALCMVISLAACGGSDTTDTTAASTTKATEATKATEEKEETKATESEVDPSKWPVITIEVNKVDDMHMEEPIENAMNARLVELNAGAQVDLIPIAFGDRSTVLTLMLTDASDPIDLFCWRFYSTVKGLKDNGQAICLDKYRTIYPELWADYPEPVYWINECNGECYSIPGNGSFCAVQVYTVVTSIMKEAGFDYKDGDRLNAEELTALCKAMEALYPDMAFQGNTAVAPFMGIDYLGNDKMVGALLNRGVGETEVVNYYATDEFKDYCYMMKDWAETGLFINDPLNNRAPGSTQINEGTCGGFMWDSCNVDHARSIMNAQIPDTEVTLLFVSDTVRDNSCVYNGWCVSTICDTPDEAMAVLYYLCTDAELTTYLTLGIEGETYVLDENGCAWYKEGVNASNAGWNLGCSWLYPNEGLTPPFETDFATKFSGLHEFWNNPDILTSNGMGFLFDKDSLFDQYTACEAAVGEYRTALLYGQAEIDSYLAKFNAELEANGMSDILAEMNKQFTAFLNK